ncbi:BCCT family transporter [Eubacterium maltosivorans]|uniref:BCCT family transporter n=1 Tax=Eubacterium maltosivorans TaxID=2041044 RepID=UPI000890C76B|nr:BCCT family transporter [Eubacterium maltosivorans]WPK81272.1 Glycine betaine transporter BetL [Eubacterium maltosivorans]SDO63268.1 Choline-glycine betaine transporter [Eubacterium maltosivorans]
MLKRIRIVPVAIPLVLMGAVLIMGIVDPNFADTMTNLFLGLMHGGGWLVALGILLFIGFLVFVYIHPIGNTKFGGTDAKPKYSTWNWWAISLCAGIGTGIVFWGATEPLSIAFTPPASAGVEPGSYAAIIWSMAKCFQHWSFQPYSIYAVAGICCGYAYWNMGKDYASSAGLCYFKNGKDLNSKFSAILDGIVLFAIVGGTAGSLGWGLLQIGSGLNFVFNIEPGPMVWTAIAVVIIISYTISSSTGLDKGIQWLSDKNAWFFIALLIFVFICGPWQYICNLTVESFGYYINNIISLTSYTSPDILPLAEAEMWPQWWDLYWMTDWLSFGPIVGLFLVKMAYGRTIRQFITVNVILPSLFGVIWFGIFGGFAINVQLTGAYDLVTYYADAGAEAFMMKFFDFVPGSEIIRVLMLILIALSFITLADSMTSTISQMSMKQSAGMKEAPLPVKVFWGVLIGAVSVLFVVTGGINGIKIVKTIAGYPMLFIEIAMIIGFLKYFLSGKAKDDEITYADILTKQRLEAEAEAAAEAEAKKNKKKRFGKTPASE